jgi:hypothetical protein
MARSGDLREPDIVLGTKHISASLVDHVPQVVTQ